MGWGGGYGGEPISEVLRNVCNSEVFEFDRWLINIKKLKEDETQAWSSRITINQTDGTENGSSDEEISSSDASTLPARQRDRRPKAECLPQQRKVGHRGGEIPESDCTSEATISDTSLVSSEYEVAISEAGDASSGQALPDSEDWTMIEPKTPPYNRPPSSSSPPALPPRNPKLSNSSKSPADNPSPPPNSPEHIIASQPDTMSFVSNNYFSIGMMRLHVCA